MQYLIFNTYRKLLGNAITSVFTNEKYPSLLRKTDIHYLQRISIKNQPTVDTISNDPFIVREPIDTTTCSVFLWRMKLYLSGNSNPIVTIKHSVKQPISSPKATRALKQ